MMDLNEFVNFPKNHDIVINKEVMIEEDQKFRLFDVTISTFMDTQVSCYLVLPTIKIRGGVYFIHWLEPDVPDSNRNQFLQIAKHLTQYGIVSILPDCFWSVDNEKYEQDPSFYREKWWKTDSKYDKILIRKQLIELKTIEQYFLRKPGLSTLPILLAAHDFGAMFGILLGQMGNVYRGYGLMAFTSRWSDWFRFGSGKTEEELEPYISAMSKLDPINFLGEISPSPLFMQFANDDFYVPLERASEIVSKAQPPKAVKYYQANHAMSDMAFEDLEKWLLDQLNLPFQ